MPTSAMQCEWLGERVATVDVARAVAGVVTGREDAGWGPNAVFRFPRAGGTGAIWRGVSRLLPHRKQARLRRLPWGRGSLATRSGSRRDCACARCCCTLLNLWLVVGSLLLMQLHSISFLRRGPGSFPGGCTRYPTVAFS